MRIRRTGRAELCGATAQSHKTSRTRLARAVRGLHLSPDAVVDHQWCDNGPAWRGLLLRSTEDLHSVSPDPELLAHADVGLIAPSSAETDFEVRAFFPGNQGITEDPVTGSLNVVILDGGMGHLLRRNGINISGPIGAVIERFRGVARANRDSPDIVLHSHLLFLRSGADVITTNTYACVPALCHEWRFPRRRSGLLQAGGALAARARDIAVSKGLSHARPLIAGCLPRDLSPDRVGDYDELSRLPNDRRCRRSLIGCPVCETMHSTAEAFAAAEAAVRLGYRCGFPSLCPRSMWEPAERGVDRGGCRGDR